jgi:hypothetical protein
MVYARGLVRDSAGKLDIYKTKVSRSWEAGRDRLWLTEQEWRSLIPERPRQGDSFPVRANITDRICRRCLIDLVRVGGNGGPRRPEEVLARDLRVTVEEVTPQKLRLRLHGTARLATHDHGSGARPGQPKTDTFQFLGAIDYDRSGRRLTRFDMVALSETGHFDEINNKVLPLGISFELSPGKTPSDRAPPSYSKDYFTR